VSFFFQAEDGIRDRNVTGVQTCALPILEKELQRLAKDIEKAEKNIAGLKGKLSNENFVSRAPENVVNAEREKLQKAESLLQQLRSEERRVGKEGRGRWRGR